VEKPHFKIYFDWLHSKSEVTELILFSPANDQARVLVSQNSSSLAMKTFTDEFTGEKLSMYRIADKPTTQAIPK